MRSALFAIEKKLLLGLAAFIVMPATPLASDAHLLPIVLRAPLRGAHGSEWVTHLTITNRTEANLFLHGIPMCGGPLSPCFMTVIPPRTTIVDPVMWQASGFPGHFFSIPAGVFDVDVVLRVRESRTALGVALPVVPERDFTGRRVGLNDIPVGSPYRSMLRVYDLQTSGDRRVRVKVFAQRNGNPDQNLAEFILPLHYSGSEHDPGYAEWPIGEIPGLLAHDHVRLELEPASDDLRFWAFVTTTESDSHQVSIVTPTRIEPAGYVRPACAHPAALPPLDTRGNPGADPDDYIVLLREGLPVPAEADRLAEKYGFAVGHTFWLAPAFTARLYATAVADLRCEPTVVSVEFSSTNIPPP